MARKRKPAGHVVSAVVEAMAVAAGPAARDDDGAGVRLPVAPPLPYPWLSIRDAVEFVEAEIALPPEKRWPHATEGVFRTLDAFNRDFATGLRRRLARSGTSWA